jgi:hypothetical protein
MRLHPWLALLLLSLAVPGCRPKPRPGVPIDPALALLVPETAAALAGVRMEALRATPVYRRYAQAPAWSAFRARTGLDPRTDVWELLFVVEPSATLVLARGRFSPGFGGLEPRLLPGAPRTTYQGYTIIGDERASTVFVNSSTALAGSGSAVRSVLDRRAASCGVPAALESPMRRLAPGAQIWAVAAAPIPALPVPLEGNWTNLNRILASLDAAWLALTLGDSVEIAAGGACSTAAEAGRLDDALRALAGLARLAAPAGRPGLARLYDSLRIRRAGREVALEAVLPPEVVGEWIAMIR